jgi:hypothetical protein
MANVTVQDYANVLSRPHTIFWDGYCTSVTPHQKIRLALTAKESGALGVLLVADIKRDIWLMTSGLHAAVSGNHITLMGANDFILKLTFAGKSAAGSLTMIVSEKKTGKKKAARLAVTFKELLGRPGRPSVTSNTVLA